jgi:hypothetical protein
MGSRTFQANRHYGPARPLGRLAAPLLAPVFRQRGFTQAQILAQWPAIVGHELARFTLPERIRWPRRSAQVRDGKASPPTRASSGAVLVIRVDGPLAIEVQHSSAQIVERVNAFFGYDAIGSLKIIQAPLPPVTETRRPTIRPLSSAGEQKLRRQLEGIGHEHLRLALKRLGRAVYLRE